ncbi:hypothetical protein C0J52_26539 [Blattella germanica]|nr:hypothetical protein C0J52_26539 [Blattella germanica]
MFSIVMRVFLVEMSIHELKGEITNYVNSITRETLQNAFQNTVSGKESNSVYSSKDNISSIFCKTGK